MAADLEALNAYSRFGLGPKAGDLKRLASDPRGAVRAELAVSDIAVIKDPKLKSTEQIAREFVERGMLKRLKADVPLTSRHTAMAEAMAAEGRLPPQTPKSADRKAPMKDGGDTMKSGGDDEKSEAMLDVPEPERSPIADEIDARLMRARSCDIGFVERWVAFWTNHFTVSAKRSALTSWMVGAYEREVIRAHVLGQFSDLALSATRHPAMLIYLNNSVSLGPHSRAGLRRGKGINENHARELLELHTVGVDGGYTQADVTSLAKALTGWRTGNRPQEDDFGRYHFDPNVHEPGPQTVMGKVYKDDGEAQGQAILVDLVHKPATAIHIARRLAIAFVADDPPSSLVDGLAKTFRETGGDLKQVALALISSDAAWSAPRAKMRTPQEFVFATARALDKSDAKQTMKVLGALGQPMWGASSPKGFSINSRDWLAPDAQTNRLDFAVEVAEQHGGNIDSNALVIDLLGDVVSDETMTTIKRAGSREQALALLLMSPEMQRR